MVDCSLERGLGGTVRCIGHAPKSSTIGSTPNFCGKLDIDRLTSIAEEVLGRLGGRNREENKVLGNNR